MVLSASLNLLLSCTARSNGGDGFAGQEWIPKNTLRVTLLFHPCIQVITKLGQA